MPETREKLFDFKSTNVSLPIEMWRGGRSYPWFPTEIRYESPRSAFDIDADIVTVPEPWVTIYRGNQLLPDLAHFFFERHDGPAILLGNPGMLCPFRGVLGERG